MKSIQRVFNKACNKGYLEIVKICVENGADIHEDYNFALRFSIYHSHYNVTKYLLEKGANPYDKYGDIGWDSFDEAIYRKNMRIIELLNQYKR